jgi:hypothetical protein
VEQVRAWETSAVLRLETPGGAYYLKSVPRHLERELRLTAALASEHSRSIPPLVAIDLDERWMPSEASVHPPLDEVIDLAAWERAAARYGALQPAMGGARRRVARARSRGPPARPAAARSRPVSPTSVRCWRARPTA